MYMGWGSLGGVEVLVDSFPQYDGAMRRTGPGTICTYPTCMNPIRSAGLCETHRKQWQKGYLTEVGARTGKRSPTCADRHCPIETKSKWCEKHARLQLGVCDSVDCDAPRRGPATEFCDAHARKDRAIRHHYGIGLEQYETMRAAQDYACLICGIREVLHVDHCHESGKVRGLLCGPCNRGIGLLAHDPTRLMNAALYVNGSA